MAEQSSMAFIKTDDGAKSSTVIVACWTVNYPCIMATPWLQMNRMKMKKKKKCEKRNWKEWQAEWPRVGTGWQGMCAGRACGLCRERSETAVAVMKATQEIRVQFCFIHRAHGCNVMWLALCGPLQLLTVLSLQ